MEDLKKLLAAATPGPWEVSERIKDWRPQVVSTEHGPICTMHIPEIGDADPNAALIVAAVNALPELVERVKRLEARIAQLETPTMQWNPGDPGSHRAHGPGADGAGGRNVNLRAARWGRGDEDE